MRKATVFVALLVCLLLLGGTAQAIEYIDGTDAQREQARATIESCELDYQVIESLFGYMDVRFVPQENLGEAAGSAWRGSIVISNVYEGDMLGQIVAHEWAHEIWIALPEKTKDEWFQLCLPFDGTTWKTNHCEHFAEVVRWNLFPSTRWYPIQTTLREIDPLLVMGALYPLIASEPEPEVETPVEPELTPDQMAIRAILAQYHSPLPCWTIEAFAQSHADFDIAGYLAVMMCESTLGTKGGSARNNNPGNLKFGGWRAPDDPKVWLRWMNGYWYSPGQGIYGSYPSMYWGQRSSIRLIYDTGYNAQLAAHDWWGFANRYYGAGVTSVYVTNLQAAHDRFVRAAAKYGAVWE